MAKFRYAFLLCVGVVLSLGLDASELWSVEFHRQPLSSSRLYVMQDSHGVYSKEQPVFPAVQISEAMLASMGIVMDSLSWGGLQLGALFNQPRATALFLVDGLTTTFPSLSKKSFGVDQTKLSGSTAGDVEAMFSGGSGVAEYLSAMFDEKAFTLSISGDEETARLAGGEHAVTSYEQMEAIMSSLNVDSVLTKYTPSVLKDKLNLDDKVDALFLAELVAMRQSVDDVKKAENVNDGIPDVYLFTFSSLKALEDKYGVDSELMTFYLGCVKECIDQMVSDLVEIYDGRIVVQALVLQWAKMPSEINQRMEQAYTFLEPHLGGKVDRNQLASSLPLKFTPQTASGSSLCSQLKVLLMQGKEGEGMKVLCGRGSRVLRSQVGAEDGGNTPHNVAQERTNNFSALFLMSFFVVLVIGLALYAFSWGIWNMDPGRDSIVYRTVPDTSEGMQLQAQ